MIYHNVEKKTPEHQILYKIIGKSNKKPIYWGQNKLLINRGSEFTFACIFVLFVSS